jgi:gliding motility-associated-like protein
VQIDYPADDACELELPTGFSPNGDGYNDGYFIRGIDRYPDNEVVVFNRWGNEVYRKSNYKNSDWVGQNKSGEPLPEGTYFLILDVKSPKQIRKNTYFDLRRYNGR